MRTIGVRKLRQDASEVLRDVERGVVYEITDRGRAVALLTPLPRASTLDQLRAAGEVEPAHGSLDDLPPPLRRPRGAARISDVLARLRVDER